LALTCSDSLLKVLHHEFKAIKGETLSSLEKSETQLDQVKSKGEKPKASYQAQAHKHKKRIVYQPGDLVWVNLRRERFPSKRKSKLMPRAYRPFEILKRVNDHAYKVYLPGDFGVSATFNVAKLSPHLGDDQLLNLRANSPQHGEDDGDPPMEPHHEPQGSPRGPSIRPKAKEKMQTLVS